MINKIHKWIAKSLTNTHYFLDYFMPFIRLFNANWSRNNYLAKVKEIREEDKETYSLVLKPSKHWKIFKAGQYIQLTIELDGRLITRTFSLSSSPQIYKQTGRVEITIRKQHKGRLTPHLPKLLKVNQYVSISEAKGEFIDKGKSNALLFIAAGSGITPINSLINDILNTTNKDLQLIYYASNDQHLFKKQLSELERKYINFKINFINTSKDKRINLNQISRLCADFKEREIFICGPSSMIENTQSLLLKENIKTKDIHFEYFTATPQKDLNIENKGIVTFLKSTIKINNAHQQTRTLLEAAESSGLTPNTGCRMGVCHQCVCKKYQGVVYNTLTKVYSDTGSQDIQLCISVPVGDVVLDL